MKRSDDWQNNWLKKKLKRSNDWQNNSLKKSSSEATTCRATRQKKTDEKRQRAEKLAEKQAEDECSGPKRHVCKGNPNVAPGSIDEDRFRCLSWFQKSSDLICTIGRKEIHLHTEGTTEFFPCITGVTNRMYPKNFKPISRKFFLIIIFLLRLD